MGRKKAGKEAGSKLLRALGRTKKEQLKALTPPGLKKARTSTSVKSNAPYTRGKVMGKGDAEKFMARREILRGVPAKSKGMSELTKIGMAGATGYAVAKLGSKYSANKQAEAKKGAADLIKKQKEQKEKNKRKKHHS